MYNDFKFYHFDCECITPEHSIRFMLDTNISYGKPELYLEMQLNKLSFWNRLVTGIKYILGSRKHNEFWECTIISPKDIPRFKEMFNDFENLFIEYNR